MAGYIEQHFKRTIDELAAELATLFGSSTTQQKLAVTVKVKPPFWFNVLAELFVTTWKPTERFFQLALLNAEIGQSFAVSLGDLRPDPVTTKDRYAAELTWVMQLAINRYACFEMMRAVRNSHGHSMTLVPLSALNFDSEAEKWSFGLSLGAQSIPNVVAHTKSPVLDRLAFCYLEWFEPPASWRRNARLHVYAHYPQARKEFYGVRRYFGQTAAELADDAGLKRCAEIRRTVFAAAYLPQINEHFLAVVRPLLVLEAGANTSYALQGAGWLPSHGDVTVAWKAPTEPI